MFSREEGFSLVEIMIVITVIAVILSLLYNLQLVGNNLWTRETNYLELQLDSIFFLKKINQDLREAIDFSLSSDNSSLTLYLDDKEPIRYLFNKSVIYRNGQKIIDFVKLTPFKGSSGLLTINLFLKKGSESYRVVDRISIRETF